MHNKHRGIVAPYPQPYTQTQEKRSFQRFTAAHCVFLLTTLSLAVYSRVFRNGFQQRWDDWWVVKNDYTEAGFNRANILSILTDFYHGQYAPVNELFYLALYAVFGYNASWFHAASLLVHVGNVLLVFFLIRRVLVQSRAFDSVSVLRISLITAVLMAVHPFLVEAVAWMSASKCILFSFFYLLSLHAYLSYIDNRRLRYFMLTGLFFVLSFGAKEQAVTLPVCLLLFDYTLKRDMRKAAVWVEKIPLFLFSAGFVVLTFYSQKYNGEGILSQQALHPWYQNLVYAAYSIAEYVIKCLLPLRLSYIYPFPNLPGQPLPVYLYLYPLIVLSVTVAFRSYWRERWVLFGIGFFLIQASVICNLIPTSRFAILADRYVYLAAVGVFFLMAYAVDWLWTRQSKYRNLLLYGGLVYILGLAIYAYQRTKVWHDSGTLKKELLEVLRSRPDYKEWQDKF